MPVGGGGNLVGEATWNVAQRTRTSKDPKTLPLCQAWQALYDQRLLQALPR